MKHYKLLIILAILIPQVLSAESIYKWVDQDGVTHYSTKKSEPKAQLADLPKITKGDFKVPALERKTCDKHGGINCDAGTDTDGSVICFDGFKEAAARFKFSCKSPKLKISDVSVADKMGRVTVFVRNEKSIAALNPEISYRSDSGNVMKLFGPEKIEPFEMAEFTLNGLTELKEGDEINKGRLKLDCSNCG